MIEPFLNFTLSSYRFFSVSLFRVLPHLVVLAVQELERGEVGVVLLEQLLKTGVCCGLLLEESVYFMYFDVLIQFVC